MDDKFPGKRPPWRPSKYDSSMPERAYLAMAQGRGIAGVAVECGVCKETVADWGKRHPDFSRAIKIGQAVGEELWMAKNGDMPPVCWIFAMKNMHGWRDKNETELTGKDGSALTVRWMTNVEPKTDA